MKTELERLKERIAQIECDQAHCEHEWGEVNMILKKEKLLEKNLFI